MVLEGRKFVQSDYDDNDAPARQAAKACLGAFFKQRWPNLYGGKKLEIVGEEDYGLDLKLLVDGEPTMWIEVEVKNGKYWRNHRIPLADKLGASVPLRKARRKLIEKGPFKGSVGYEGLPVCYVIFSPCFEAFYFIRARDCDPSDDHPKKTSRGLDWFMLTDKYIVQKVADLLKDKQIHQAYVFMNQEGVHWYADPPKRPIRYDPTYTKEDIPNLIKMDEALIAREKKWFKKYPALEPTFMGDMMRSAEQSLAQLEKNPMAYINTHNKAVDKRKKARKPR